MLLQEIIQHLRESGIEVTFQGNEQTEIEQVSSLVNATDRSISFFSDRKRLPELQKTQAAAVIVNQEFAEACPKNGLIVQNPYHVYALVAQLLNPPEQFPVGIHPTAIVDDSAQIGENVVIMGHAVIGKECQIGDNTVIMAGTVIGDYSTIGHDCRIAPNVVIMHDCHLGNNTTIEAGTVIGGDGFGWANHQGKWIKIPQIGRVIIGSYVSVGNNCAIDRGAIEDTIIEDHCIIDNLVQIAHNVHIGRGSAIAGQAGFAGSTILGKNCTVAGQAGFAGHLTVTDKTHIMAKAGVTHDLNEPGAYAGFPAISASEWHKQSVRSRQLDKMARKMKELERELAEIKDLAN
ncbi:UDP-3-O-(3-hydroxymyristoyl)glucosamine N-acyltransferase [Thiomicrorhabdus sp. zzn3]|uniref:UDP-3-O-(3-hydroxymyristoyl)glucosamine N-acyltransferase n=1 Tax=Thiomicrorhabdus sp. zzn3 TaxID=3039775 RepID=UPI0024369882|nr:UDP-3-O-(3-hydroxymyristoyl)glucosamine N-acyltransferase [Thiomicrorhabdus sp. zzn3]MDG6777985.1 UDP-3-O-(3-hydroxymyristoyl)glucosamine N-acyltransferase [Thiomicrorhabdus sp. zzn3]